MASFDEHSQHGRDRKPQWPSPEEPSVARDGGGAGKEGENVMDKLLNSFQDVLSGGGGSRQAGGTTGGTPDFMKSFQAPPDLMKSFQAHPWLSNPMQPWLSSPTEKPGPRDRDQIHPDLIEGAFADAASAPPGGGGMSDTRDSQRSGGIAGPASMAPMGQPQYDARHDGDGWEEGEYHRGQEHEEEEEEDGLYSDEGDRDDDLAWSDEEEYTEEYSRLKDVHGNPLPYPTDQWYQDIQREYQYLHHEDAEDQMASKPRLRMVEHGLFRKPRETPGWFPGGRFLMHKQSSEAVEDMQDRENYAARKRRILARDKDEEDRAKAASELRQKAKGDLPGDFARRCERAQGAVKAKLELQMVADQVGLRGTQLTREELLDINKHKMQTNLDDYSAGKGRRSKKIESFVKEREKTLLFLGEDRNAFWLGPTIELKTDGRKFGTVPKDPTRM